MDQLDGLERLEAYATERAVRAETAWLQVSFSDEAYDAGYSSVHWREVVRVLQALRLTIRLAYLLQVDGVAVSFHTADLEALCDVPQLHGLLMAQLHMIETAFAHETRQVGVPARVKAEAPIPVVRQLPQQPQPRVDTEEQQEQQEEEEGSSCVLA